SAPVSMGVICFRAKHGIDAFNSRIVESINQSGRAYLNQTKLRGQTVIRLGLGNILTTEKHLRDAWELIRETARSLASSSRAKGRGIPRCYIKDFATGSLDSRP